MLSGAGEALWQDKLAGKPGDLLDLIQAESPHATEAKALAAGLSFIEAEAKARRQLNTELAPHAEAVCERYLPGGVKRDGQWCVEHTVLRARDFAVSVQLSGRARGAWRTESGALNGDLLDLIHLRARYDTITGAMAVGRTIRDELIEAHREAQLELRREWDAHAASESPGRTRTGWYSLSLVACAVSHRQSPLSRSISPIPKQLIASDSTNAAPRPSNYPDSTILDNLVTHAG